jgi:hypothetical protein
VVAQIQGHKPSATAEKHYKRRPLDLLRVHHERIEAWVLEQAGVPFDAKASATAGRGPLLSEFRYGTWSRSFRFPSGIDRENLSAHYQSGLLTVRVPKAQTMTTVSVKVEG